MKFTIIRSLNGKLIKKSIEQKQLLERVITAPMDKQFKNTMNILDGAFGASQVRVAQKMVMHQEKCFLQARDVVHTVKQDLDTQQDFLNEMRDRLDRCSRSDEKYLTYVAEEHNLLLNTKKLQRDYKAAEEEERRRFTEFSTAVRVAHEQERARTERTKYWSIIGSVTGTVLGFMCSSFLIYERLKTMKDINQSAIFESSSRISKDLEEQKNALLHQFLSLKDYLLQNKDGSSLVNEGNTNPTVKTEDNLLGLLSDLSKEIKTIPAKNKEYLQTLTDQLLQCFPNNEKFDELKKNVAKQLNEFKESRGKSLDSLSTALLKSMDEKIKTSQTESTQDENIECENEDGFVGTRTLNVFLTVATLTFVAVSSWKDIFS